MLVKGRANARLQRKRVEETLDFTVRPLDPARPTFRFVHFSVPHHPYVFDANGYIPLVDPWREPLSASYAAQLRYTDGVFGEILSRIRRARRLDQITVAVFADHGFRFADGPKEDFGHVPFIVKRAGQTERIDVHDEERGELLLRSLVERCAG
jgi:membrane-anchored protein YejM (alkaline phosphatase superfamily)